MCCGLLHFAIGILCGKIRKCELYFFVESVILMLIRTQYNGFFVYAMSRVQIRACTKICIRRMYIIESTDEMQSIQNRVGERVMKNIRRIVLGMCLLIGMVCGNVVIVQAEEEEIPIMTIGDYECTWDPAMTITDIVKYKGSDANVTIPAELGGRKVFAIDFSAFENCTSLETVVISDGIMHIYDSAFEGCSNLKNIIIPDSVKNIYSDAFKDCSSLTAITIPEGVPEIRYRAFEGCTELQKVTLPASSLKTIQSYAFDGCEKLTAIQLPDSVTEIGDYVFMGCTSLTAIALPDTMKSIPNGMFSRCTALTSIQIPDNVTSIEKSAFHGCSSLLDVKIPEGVTDIGESAFFSCENLKSITLPQSINSMGERVFGGCDKLESVRIPDNVKTIKEYIFGGCHNLVEVILPDELTSIETRAFSRCTSLKNITIPQEVTEIGERAFEECSSLESVMIPEGVQNIGECTFCLCGNLSSVLIPDSVTEVGMYAFWGCTKLENIQLPNELQMLGEGVFSACEGLETIVIPEGVTSISENMFSDCKSLKSVSIPKSAKSIGSSAFRRCTSLQNITIPEGVTRISTFAFCDCPGLLDIEFPKSVEYIGGDLFGYESNTMQVAYVIPESYADWWLNDKHDLYDGKYSVGYILDEENCRVKVLSEGDSSTVEYRNPIEKDAEEYTIPDTVTISGVTYRVTSIADDAFSACSNVKKVTLGQNVEQIQPDAFAGVVEEEGDLELVIPEELEDISNIGIPNISNVNHLTINVAAGSKAEIYLQQNATIHYHTYPSTKNPEPDKKDDTEDASKNQAGVDEPVIGRSYPVGNGKYKMLSTDKVAFVGAVNKKKKTLKIPDVVTIAGRLHRVVRIEKRAMKGCATLQTVMIGNQVTEIGEEAFYKCKKLQKVTIGSRVVKIGKGAFRSDKKLKRLIFKGSKVKKIGKKALKGVPRKVKITAPKKSVPKYKKLLNAAK